MNLKYHEILLQELKCIFIMFVYDFTNMSDRFRKFRLYFSSWRFICKSVTSCWCHREFLNIWKKKEKKKTITISPHTFPCWHINVVFPVQPGPLCICGVIIKRHVHKNTMEVNTMLDQRWKSWFPRVCLRQIPTYIPTHVVKTWKNGP